MKKQGGVIFGAFLLGILLANLTGSKFFSDYGILNAYYLNQFAYRNIDCDKLFCFVLFERIKAAVFVVILTRFLKSKYMFCLAESILAMVLGYILVVSIANLGVFGIGIVLGAIFPQWLFYQADLFLYAAYKGSSEAYCLYGKQKYKKIGNRLLILGVLAVIFIAGVVAESYFNPIIFCHILKVF